MITPNGETEESLTKRLFKTGWAESREANKGSWNTLGLATVGAVTSSGSLRRQEEGANNGSQWKLDLWEGPPQGSCDLWEKKAAILNPQRRRDERNWGLVIQPHPPGALPCIPLADTKQIGGEPADLVNQVQPHSGQSRVEGWEVDLEEQAEE